MSKLANKLYFKALSAKDKMVNLVKSESGETNLVAIILILAIVIALVVIFRGYLTDIFESIWNKIKGDVGSAIK